MVDLHYANGVQHNEFVRALLDPLRADMIRIGYVGVTSAWQQVVGMQTGSFRLDDWCNLGCVFYACFWVRLRLQMRYRNSLRTALVPWAATLRIGSPQIGRLLWNQRRKRISAFRYARAASIEKMIWDFFMLVAPLRWLCQPPRGISHFDCMLVAVHPEMRGIHWNATV